MPKDKKAQIVDEDGEKIDIASDDFMDKVRDFHAEHNTIDPDQRISAVVDDED